MCFAACTVDFTSGKIPHACFSLSRSVINATTTPTPTMEEEPHQQPQLDLLSWISDLNSFGNNGQLPTSESSISCYHCYHYHGNNKRNGRRQYIVSVVHAGHKRSGHIQKSKGGIHFMLDNFVITNKDKGKSVVFSGELIYVFKAQQDLDGTKNDAEFARHALDTNNPTTGQHRTRCRLPAQGLGSTQHSARLDLRGSTCEHEPEQF
jgi:hypothetical protein